MLPLRDTGFWQCNGGMHVESRNFIAGLTAQNAGPKACMLNGI